MTGRNAVTGRWLAATSEAGRARRSASLSVADPLVLCAGHIASSGSQLIAATCSFRQVSRAASLSPEILERVSPSSSPLSVVEASSMMASSFSGCLVHLVFSCRRPMCFRLMCFRPMCCRPMTISAAWRCTNLTKPQPFSGGDLDVCDLPKALEKRAKLILGDVAGEAANEDGGVVRVGELVHLPSGGHLTVAVIGIERGRGLLYAPSPQAA